jgi:hypothetical protein
VTETVRRRLAGRKSSGGEAAGEETGKGRQEGPNQIFMCREDDFTAPPPEGHAAFAFPFLAAPNFS